MTCSEPVVSPTEFGWSGKIIVAKDPVTGLPTEARDYSVKFTVHDDNAVKFESKLNSSDTRDSFFALGYASDADEEIYGLGLQYSVWDFKGRSVPLISTEGGVGRGLQPLSTIMNAAGGAESGTDVTSYAPSATYITNKSRAFVFDQSQIGIADFT